MGLKDQKSKGIPTWSKNLRRWSSVVAEETDGPGFDGSDALWSALWTKDLGALAQVLKIHPEIIAEEFISRNTKGRELSRGRLSRMIVNLGWTDALDVLWQAGDRFDLPDKKNRLRNERSYCIFEHVIFEGKLPALNRMLKLGVDPNASSRKSAEPSMAILLVGSYQRDSDQDVSAILVKAGVDPWRKLPTHPNQPIVVALLTRNRSHAALSLLGSMQELPSPEAGKALVQAWMAGANQAMVGNHAEDSLKILKHLHRLGCPPPALQDAVVLGSMPVFNLLEDRAAVHVGLMDFLCDTGYYTVSDWTFLRKAFETVSYEGSGRWKANIEHIHLNEVSAPGNAPKRSHHRL